MSGSLSSRLRIAGVEKPVSTLALGAAFFNLEEKERWFAILDAFVARGGTLVDSARVYGASEDVLGEWIAARSAREQIILLTKCGHGADHRLPVENFEEMVSRELGTSLEKLRTDYVDVYMLHRDNPALTVGRIVERLNREIEAGRVRSIGASNWTYERVEEANRFAAEKGLHEFAMVSNHLSLAESSGPFYPGLVSVDDEGQRWHSRTGTPLLSWAAQARGFFTGHFTEAMAAAPDSIEDPITRRMIEVYGTPGNFERLRRAQALGKKHGRTPMEIALAWVLRQPFPVVPVVGPRRIEELDSCVAATTVALSEEERRWLNLET